MLKEKIFTIFEILEKAEKNSRNIEETSKGEKINFIIIKIDESEFEKENNLLRKLGLLKKILLFIQRKTILVGKAKSI